MAGVLPPAPPQRLEVSVLRMSTLLLRTLREDPADAEVPGHRLLVRAGYIRRSGPGIHAWLPLGHLVLRNVERIVREEMVRTGVQDVLLPALLPREPYEVTDRWTEYGDNVFRLRDRRQADYLLGPTHEEMLTLLVEDQCSSWLGHIFQLGRKYAEGLGLQVLDENGRLVTVTMGSYGLGVSRAVGAIAEAHHDDLGLCWPRSVAPADVHLVATGKDPSVHDTADRLAADLEAAGVRVLYDDRRVSPGVKFTDAELIGVPTVLVAGRNLADGTVEVRDRRTGDRCGVPLADAVAAVVTEVGTG